WLLTSGVGAWRVVNCTAAVGAMRSKCVAFPTTPSRTRTPSRSLEGRCCDSEMTLSLYWWTNATGISTLMTDTPVGLQAVASQRRGARLTRTHLTPLSGSVPLRAAYGG